MDDFACRLAVESDLPQLAKLWAEESAWGELAPLVWDHLIATGPLEPPAIVIAEDATGMIAQLVLHRTRVMCHGEQLRGLRPFAAVVASAWRARGLSGLFRPGHPLMAIIDYSFGRVDADLAHTLPDPRFMRFLAHQPWATIWRYPLYSRPLDAPPALPAGTSWSRYEVDERLDELVARGVPEPCFVLRDPAAVRWKALAAGQHLVAVERGGDLLAVVAGRYHGDRQWQIEDVIAADAECRRLAIAAAVQAGAAWRDEHAGGARPVKAGILATEAFVPLLDDLGFTPDNYEYTYLLVPMGGTRATFGSASDWYVSAAD